MILRAFVALTLFGISIASAAQAAPTMQQQEMAPYKCMPTPAVKVQFPANKDIGKTNNLWRKAGLAVPAEGRPVYIRGVVLDKDCVPVSGAVVQIWQADAKGNYDLGDKSENKVDPYFGASGTTTTNNLGEYGFITVFPGAADNESPYIRFRIKQRDTKVLRTKMYFPSTDSSKDKDYKKLSEKNRGLLTAASGGASGNNPVTYYFNITLKGKVPYKGY